MLKKPSFKIIFGLGNPGEEYAKTYHNVGFLASDYLAKNPPISKSKFPMPTGRRVISKQFSKKKNFEYLKTDGVIIIKPTLYMNESGNAVKEALKYFSSKGGSLPTGQAGASGEKIKPEEVLIVHDDVDIEIGKYKLDFDRGSAGHHGVESIIKSLKTKNFWRLRIGIAPEMQIHTNTTTNAQRLLKRKKAIEYVLKKISKKDMEKLEEVFNQIAQKLSQELSQKLY